MNDLLLTAGKVQAGPMGSCWAYLEDLLRLEHCIFKFIGLSDDAAARKSDFFADALVLSRLLR